MQFLESKNPSILIFYSNLLPQTVLPTGTKCSDARGYRGNSNSNHCSFPTNFMENWKLDTFFTKGKGNVAVPCCCAIFWGVLVLSIPPRLTPVENTQVSYHEVSQKPIARKVTGLSRKSTSVGLLSVHITKLSL